MTTKITQQYLDNLYHWVKETKHKDELQELLTDNGCQRLMKEYNKAYSKFVYKFLESSPTVKQTIKDGMRVNVYNKIKNNLK